MESILFIIMMFSNAVHIRKNRIKKKYGKFWLVQPFATPIIFSVALAISIFIHKDLIVYSIIVIMLQEFVFWIVMKKNYKG